jgi:hypothetical protein
MRGAFTFWLISFDKKKIINAKLRLCYYIQQKATTTFK